MALPVGIPLAALEEMLGFACPMARIVANLGAELGASVTCFCSNDLLTEPERSQIIATLETVGSVIDLDEKYFDIFTVIAGSGPAFAIQFTESLVEAALSEGLPKAKSRQIVAAMLEGTAAMLRADDPHALIDRICSPGGTTIAGLNSLTAHGFEASIHAGVADAMKKLTGD